ncbi:MAG: DNA-3-methyladenine glycosylase I [Gammaproteobacteria bacterium]|nr:DNA-3-methyladenine glycosylase I [Pseudomonadota bacterium]TDJ29878.1 MAG: DNA-3-methyladenine glycosylase I [Gammaproteobacteria bacterium]TDJ37906.1 MAG: DNA-3-methyladenine glycosylase I [Gammaproteobacteria bacterium]
MRCTWCGNDPLYVEYHDKEWGIPEKNETALFERIVLEGMQAGLSWITVLRKREHMRACFFNFDPAHLAKDGPGWVSAWLEDSGLIRHRGKLDAMVSNARIFLEFDDFAGYLWSFVNGAPKQNCWGSLSEVPVQTVESIAMAKGLKKLGFRFVGPTTCYAFMQSAGLVNDHLVNCASHAQCQKLGADWIV